jgi:predicted transcriptional regulator
MRTTIRLDSELLERLKAQARRESVSLTALVNRTLRQGLKAARNKPVMRRQYREQPVAMGASRVPLDKALNLAAALEEEEVSRELGARQ